MYYFCLLVIVQIIFESFPISSSGHVQLLLCLSNFMGYSGWQQYALYSESVDYLLHGPTLIILMLYFYKRWWPLISRWRSARVMIMRSALLLVCADGITVLSYFFLKPLVGGRLPLWTGFFITACALGSLRLCVKKKYVFGNIKKGLILGCAQSIALFPGISRFALTYVAARWMRIRPERSFELSMLIQCPLIMVAFIKSLYDMSMSPLQGCSPFLGMIIGGATVISYWCLTFVGYCIKKELIWFFSLYMVLPMIISLWLC